MLYFLFHEFQLITILLSIREGHLSKTMCGAFHFRFRFFFINVYIFVQQNA